MADPNVNNTNISGTLPLAPPVYDPYQTLIRELPLPDHIFSLLTPTFEQLGCPLTLDDLSVKDYGKNPLPHHCAALAGEKIVLLHVGSLITANPYGLPFLFPAVSPFLRQAVGLFIFSEVETLAFSADDLISTWQTDYPNLRAGFITLPQLQELESAPDNDQRAQKIKDLLGLNELLARFVSATAGLSLEQLLEHAYRLCDPKLLANAPGLPEKLTKADREFITDYLARLAFNSPGRKVKDYYISLLEQHLGIESKFLYTINRVLTGDPANDAHDILLILEDKTYPNRAMPGYSKILGKLLSYLAEDGGGGKPMVLLIFKYHLVDDINCLRKLTQKYP